MMIGSILLNFWAALISFSIYFLFMFQKPDSSFNILMGSFLFAIVGFVIMFLIRYLIGYILYTPDESILMDELDEMVRPHQKDDLQLSQNTSSSTQVNESSEEIAQVVKTMMNS